MAEQDRTREDKGTMYKTNTQEKHRSGEDTYTNVNQMRAKQESMVKGSKEGGTEELMANKTKDKQWNIEYRQHKYGGQGRALTLWLGTFNVVI